jgi:hypothetical protein
MEALSPLALASLFCAPPATAAEYWFVVRHWAGRWKLAGLFIGYMAYVVGAFERLSEHGLLLADEFARLARVTLALGAFVLVIHLLGLDKTYARNDRP